MSETEIKRVRPTTLLLCDLTGFHPRLLSGTFLLMLARSLSEGASFMLLVPLLSMAGDIANGGITADVPKGLVRLQSLFPFKPTVALMLGLFLVLVLLRAALGYASTMAANRFQAGFIEHVRWRVYRALSRANWMYLAGTRQGLDMQSLTEQTGNAAAATHYVVGLAAGGLTILTGLAVAFALSPRLTLLVLASGILVAVPMVNFQRWAYARGATSMNALNALYDVLVARLNGLKLAKAFAIEKDLEKDFASAADAYRRALLASQENSARATLFQDCAMAILLAVMVYVALVLFAVSSLELILLIVIFARLAPIVGNVAHGLRALAGCLPSYGALREREAAALAAEEPISASTSRLAMREGVALRGVKFAYPGNPSAPVLAGITISLAAGSATGIIGLSGAGKSTLADVVAGLLPPDCGEVLIDGVPLDAERRAQWRASIAYLPQDAPLFHDTLRENLRIAARTASDAEIWECLEIVQAAELVRSLPEGLDTMAGERGVRLSGGEQQRIRLASALLRRPRLLILDESTSALNPADEARVVAALRRLRGVLTILLIAHRASSIGWTDRALFMQNGRVEADGTPAEVLMRIEAMHGAQIELPTKIDSTERKTDQHG